MSNSDLKPDGARALGPHSGFKFYTAGEEMLDRVKSVAQQIEQRVREISEERPSDEPTQKEWPSRDGPEGR